MRKLTVILSAAVVIGVAVAALAVLQGQRPSSTAACKTAVVTPVSAKLLVSDEGCGVGVLELLVTDSCAVTLSSIHVGDLAARPLGLNETVTVRGPRAYVIVYHNPYTRTTFFTAYSGPDPESYARSLIAKGLCIPGLALSMNYPGSVKTDGKVIYYTWVTVPAGG